MNRGTQGFPGLIITPEQGILKIAVNGIRLDATGDTIIPIPAFAGNPHYFLWQTLIRNSGSVASLTAAQYGLFTAAAGGGVALIAGGTALSAITSNADNTLANMTIAAPAQTIALTQSTVPNIYFRVTQADSAGAAVDVALYLRPLN